MKLIDLLVKELPKLGGWPEGAEIAVQDADSQICFSSHSDVYANKGQTDWYGGDWGDGDWSNPFIDIIADDRHECIVSRKQYEAALAASDGWIEWHGGKCPVDSDAIVEVKYRSPNQYQYNNDRAGDFAWAHDGIDGDIIAYRLQQPGIDTRTNDDQLEQDLNECIGQDVGVPEWTGDGLPPVGIKCEHCPGGTTQHEWEVVTVAGIHENTSAGFTDYWLVRENGSSYIVGNPYRFRPLRTEAEKVREDAETAMRTCLAGAGAGITPLAAKGIYEAIAAGKIPGVKLEDK